jgi:hypothetical protein
MRATIRALWSVYYKNDRLHRRRQEFQFSETKRIEAEEDAMGLTYGDSEDYIFGLWEQARFYEERAARLWRKLDNRRRNWDKYVS